MKRTLVVVASICFASLLFASSAFPWGSATHAYVDDHLGLRGPGNLKELYGGMAPDIFNYLFGHPYQDYFCAQTHIEGFLKVWSAARSASGRAFGYGFVSHNDVWGADCIAHCLLNPCPPGAGYVDAKAAILWGILKQTPEFGNLGLSDAVGLAVCHNLVESGVDLLVKRRLDPMIGWKVASSALLRSPDFPLLLIKAYAGDFSGKTGMSYPDTVKLVTSAEMEFRKTTILYGQVLMQDEATAIRLVSEQLAGLAEVAYGISLDPNLLKPLIESAIARAMQPDI